MRCRQWEPDSQGCPHDTANPAAVRGERLAQQTLMLLQDRPVALAQPA